MFVLTISRTDVLNEVASECFSYWSHLRQRNESNQHTLRHILQVQKRELLTNLQKNVITLGEEAVGKGGDTPTNGKQQYSQQGTEGEWVRLSKNISINFVVLLCGSTERNGVWLH